MRVFLGLALIFSLSPLVEASTFAPSSFASSTKKHPQHHQSLEMLLDVRGGGGIAIDKDTVAQVATTVSLVHGTINQMCPKVTCETYGVKDSPVVTFLMRRLGTTLIRYVEIRLYLQRVWVLSGPGRKGL